MFNRKIIGYLKDWKEKKGRKPLILRGARQVGKTSAVLMFGEKYFNDVVYINLENPEHLRLFREEISLSEFEDIVRIKFNKKIDAEKTLIFIDEIQNSQYMINLLRFFYENRPQYCVIGAGSLLEAKMQKEGFSVPVGRVEFAYLYPLDFFEFLQAKREKELLDYLQDSELGKNIPEAIHQHAMQNFYNYTMLGGMPEVLKLYFDGAKMQELKTVYSSLMTAYAEDVYKYSSKADAKYLSFIIDTAPLYAGQIISYEKFGGSDYKSREMSKAFGVLDKVMLLHQVKATKSTEHPIVTQEKRSKKLIFLDVGLVNYRMDIQKDFLQLKDLNSLYRGRISEQVIGQNILAQFINETPKLCYWAKQKYKGAAEVDFCLPIQGKIFGIEVKSGSTGKLRSLFSFANAVKDGIIVRVYGGKMLREELEYNGKRYTLISLPFYLIPRMMGIVNQLPG